MDKVISSMMWHSMRLFSASAWISLLIFFCWTTMSLFFSSLKCVFLHVSCKDLFSLLFFDLGQTKQTIFSHSSQSWALKFNEHCSVLYMFSPTFFFSFTYKSIYNAYVKRNVNKKNAEQLINSKCTLKIQCI